MFSGDALGADAPFPFPYAALGADCVVVIMMAARMIIYRAMEEM